MFHLNGAFGIPQVQSVSHIHLIVPIKQKKQNVIFRVIYANGIMENVQKIIKFVLVLQFNQNVKIQVVAIGVKLIFVKIFRIVQITLLIIAQHKNGVQNILENAQITYLSHVPNLNQCQLVLDFSLNQPIVYGIIMINALLFNKLQIVQISIILMKNNVNKMIVFMKTKFVDIQNVQIIHRLLVQL